MKILILISARTFHRCLAKAPSETPIMQALVKGFHRESLTAIQLPGGHVVPIGQRETLHRQPQDSQVNPLFAQKLSPEFDVPSSHSPAILKFHRAIPSTAGS